MSPLPVNLGDGVVLRHYEMDDLPALWEAIEAERSRLGEWPSGPAQIDAREPAPRI